MDSLNIRRDACALDFLALGSIVQRLDPGDVPIRVARTFDVHVSGGEYNVAANLAGCFGLKTGIATALPQSSIGELVERRVREMGVTPFFKRFVHDGVRGPNIAIVYSDRGFGVRPPTVAYNRANEAGALLQPGDFDWNRIFSQGIRWFHSGGIFALLADTTGELILEAMQAAKRAGAICSFDLNYRAKLWAALPGGIPQGQQLLRRIASHVDVLVGVGKEDYALGLGIDSSQQLSRPVQSTAACDLSDFEFMVTSIRNEFPNIQCVATTRRHVRSSCRHDWKAMLYLGSETYETPIAELDIIDRIGGGDGFASGLFYGLITGRHPAEALRLGWAHGALVTTTVGDVSVASLSEVEVLALGNNASVQR